MHFHYDEILYLKRVYCMHIVCMLLYKRHLCIKLVLIRPYEFADKNNASSVQTIPFDYLLVVQHLKIILSIMKDSRISLSRQCHQKPLVATPYHLRDPSSSFKLLGEKEWFLALINLITGSYTYVWAPIHQAFHGAILGSST